MRDGIKTKLVDRVDSSSVILLFITMAMKQAARCRIVSRRCVVAQRIILFEEYICMHVKKVSQIPYPQSPNSQHHKGKLNSQGVVVNILYDINTH